MLTEAPKGKFEHPEITAKGETRASVYLNELKTLWFNTGTQCNLSCENCYIESTPKNDRLEFITKAEVIPFLEEIKEQSLPVVTVGLTGGEPFMNPEIIGIIEEITFRGMTCLVLTNAHRLINRHKTELLRLKNEYGKKLQIRVSLDHYLVEEHEAQRGKGTFESTLKSTKWLSDEGFELSIAGRSLEQDLLNVATEGYQKLMDEYGIKIQVDNPRHFVLFPEMKSKKDVPEITTACWDILEKSPDSMMCASERMVVKKKGRAPSVLACTLLAYDDQFDLGPTLKEAKKSVPLNHRFCAEFCVLGGASCSSTV